MDLVCTKYKVITMSLFEHLLRICSAAQDFNISIEQVNWLGNIVNLTFLPASLVIPFLCKRYGLRTCCFYGAACLVLAAWVRFAGTATSLSPGGAYALLLVGQVCLRMTMTYPGCSASIDARWCGPACLSSTRPQVLPGVV